MRLFGFLLAGALLAASSTSAQVSSPTLLMPSAATATLATTAPAPSSASDSASAPYLLPPEPAAPAPKPQGGVIGVYENYDFQAYVGYTFLRFYEAPGHIQSRSGFDSSVIYYYHAGFVGLDGSLVGGFGSQFGERSRFLFAGGGPRFRWSAPRNLEVFGHALVGGSHYTPQTAYGSQGAFAYEVGLGVDANAHHQRLAYQLEVDMIGSEYFNTQQLSPKASIGLVWKF
jgi:hypothetical protein